MAENNFNYFQAMTNPQFAANQQILSRQQALASQMLSDSDRPDDVNKLANPGGFVIPYSPLQGLAKALEGASGAYAQKKLDDKQLALYQDLHDQQVRSQDMYGTATDAAIGNQVGPASAQDVANQYGPKLAAAMTGGNTQGFTPQEIANLMLDPSGKMSVAAFEQRQKNQNYINEAAAKAPYETQTLADGTVVPKTNIAKPASAIQPNASALIPPSLQQAIAQQSGQETPPPEPPQPILPPPQSPPLPPAQAAQVDSLYGAGAENPTPMGNINIGSNGQASFGSSPSAPPVLSSDDKGGPVNIMRTPANVNPNSPEGAANAAGLKAEATKSGENTAEAKKNLAAINSTIESQINNLNTLKNLSGRMPDRGPHETEVWLSKHVGKQDISSADADFNTLNKQMFVNGLMGSIPPGSRLDIPIVKALQAAKEVDANLDDKSRKAVIDRHIQTLKEAQQNAYKNYGIQSGERQSKAPMNQPVVNAGVTHVWTPNGIQPVRGQ